MGLVDREVVGNLVVRANSAWVAHDQLAGAVLALILDKVLDIVFGELSIETLLHILDFLGLDWVIIVGGGLVDELLVKCTLQEKVEVGHESGVVTILILSEDRLQSEIDLLLLLVLFWHGSEAESELSEGNESQTVDEADDSLL